MEFEHGVSDTLAPLFSLPEEDEGASGMDHEDMPMSLMLNGNEPYFESFSESAEKVMAILGIKRSRLNQISGQELRVGRKREGRYIKPYYRPEDIKSYSEWVRATASHKKSADTLVVAADVFSETMKDMQADWQEWHEIMLSLKTVLKHQTEAQLRTQAQLLKQTMAQQHKERQHAGRQLEGLLANLIRSQSKQNDVTQEVLTRLQMLQESYLLLHKMLQEQKAILLRQEANQSHLCEDIKALHTSLQDLQVKIETPKSCFRKAPKRSQVRPDLKTPPKAPIYGTRLKKSPLKRTRIDL